MILVKKEQLDFILDDLKRHKGRNRAEVMEECVSNRLNKSLETYYHELQLRITNITSKSFKRVVKSL